MEQQLEGRELYDSAGEKVGTIDRVFVDNETGKPEWAGVSSGFLGSSKSIVPLTGANPGEQGVTVPYSKEQIKNAPGVNAGNEIGQDDEKTLFEHYGVSYDDSGTVTGQAGPQQSADMQASGMGDTGDSEHIALKEEVVTPSKTQTEAGEVRVAKDVVTEQRQVEVPRMREEVTVERRPVDGRVAESGIGDDQQIRVPLHEEQVQLDKQTVVREELEVGKRQVQETVPVSADVRREEARVEGEGNIVEQQR